MNSPAEIFQPRIHFFHSFVPIKGSGWMGRFPNGSYSGMASQLVYEGADISISQSAMLISTDVLESISFLHPTSTGQFMALFRQPKASSYRNLMTSVFSNNTLACYVAMWIIIVFGILILSSFQLKMRICKEWDLDFVKESASWAIATACITAWYRRPTSVHLRLATFVGSFVANFGYVAFSAGITVNLITEPVPIQNVEQLASSTLEKITDKFLFVSNDVFKQVYGHNNKGNKKQLTIQDALSKLLSKQDDGMAFITLADGLATVFHQMSFPDNIFCEAFSAVMLESAKIPAAMSLKRDSPLKNTLNLKILLLGERGFLRRLNKDYNIKTQIHCLDEPQSCRGGLALDDTWTAFAVLASGIILSLLGLEFEILKQKCMNE
ncbi:unnamed protein product [Orchesella dallaii]|uniref:Ionotropic glutamate receptor C-terminal domain-containing protein n=1 Tax=Orchesella dallaii TaxID=48710 RepID=A0ABP1QGS6_9HEXA